MICSFPKKLKFTKGSFEECTLYTFGKKTLGHYFCPVCGCSAVSKQLEGAGSYAVNARCVEGITLRELKALKFVEYDGAAL